MLPKFGQQICYSRVRVELACYKSTYNSVAHIIIYIRQNNCIFIQNFSPFKYDGTLLQVFVKYHNIQSYSKIPS